MTIDIEVAKKYAAVQQSAKTRGLVFDISFAEFKKIYNTKKCYYTGKRLMHGANFSFDRVDNSKGYVSGNIVACDITFNHLKANLSLEQIDMLTKGIKKFYDGKHS